MTENAELEAQMRQRSRAFDAWALDYDRYRPTYPQEMFEYIAARFALPADARVADLGAGTGKAARQMARRGWHVIAVEPGEGMLGVLRARAAEEGLEIEARLASAEETGLDGASVDLATAAQAYHWFDKPRAVTEMARIVRPGGGVALFWNAPAVPRSDFLAEEVELLARYVPEGHVDRHDNGAHDPPEAIAESDLFMADGWIEFSHERMLSADDFVALTFTASQVQLFVDDAVKDQFRAELRELIARHFGDQPVALPYDTSLFLTQRTEVPA